MTSVGAGVFWPLNTDPEFHPVGVFPSQAPTIASARST
jgi:hypothetical protein